MSGNRTADSGGGRRYPALSMQEFDSLPKYVRDALNYAPYRLTLRDSDLAQIARGQRIAFLNERQMIRAKAAAAYGPGHPPAQLQLDDIGF